MNRPNLFIVGAPRCGTTSICTYLHQHPNIYILEEKEVHHFCPDLHKESDTFHEEEEMFNFGVRKRKRYLNLFQNDDEKIAGEGSTRYLYSEAAPHEIYNFNKQSKIIIMIRNPVNFMYSCYFNNVRSGAETAETFEKAIELESDRKKGKKIPESAKVPSDLLYKSRARFSKYIKRYFQVFTREKVKIIPLEDLRNTPQQVYNHIIEFLDLQPYTPSFKVKNQTKVPSSRLLQQFIQDPSYSFKPILKKILPNSLQNMTYKFLNKLNTRRKKPPMDRDMKERLKKELKPEVEALSRICRRDFVSLWDYDK